MMITKIEYVAPFSQESSLLLKTTEQLLRREENKNLNEEIKEKPTKKIPTLTKMMNQHDYKRILMPYQCLIFNHSFQINLSIN